MYLVYFVVWEGSGLSDRNENRTGYKKTKVGWIPEDWEIFSGKEITNLIAKGSSPRWQGYEYTSAGTLFITSENVRDGYLNISMPKYIPPEFHRKLNRTQIRKGDILINLVGASIGRSCVVNQSFNSANINQAVSVFRIKNGIYHAYIGNYFQAPNTIRRILGMQVDAARPNISLTDLRSFLIPLPPLPEQKRIAEILSTWDKAIDQTRKLIDAKKFLKKALMQQLLTGKKRLRGFNEPWKEYSLGELFDERIELNNHDLPLLAITGSLGVIQASAIVRKDSSAADKSRYKRIAPGDIGYNTMRMWQGVSAISSMEGIVSPAYTICVPKNNIDSSFIGYFFKFPPVIYLFWRYSQGLVSDTLNLKFHNFSQIRIKIPSLKEQQKIADILYSVDAEIDSFENKLSALEKQKRGLMQKLLTGEIRVKA